MKKQDSKKEEEKNVKKIYELKNKRSKIIAAAEEALRAKNMDTYNIVTGKQIGRAHF